MKTIKLYTLILLLSFIGLTAFAQRPAKQTSGGVNGTVVAPANALGNDLSKCSTLKLKDPSEKNSYAYQNFVFSPANTKDTRVVFVIQTDEHLDAKKDAMLNLKFFTGMSGAAADTVKISDMQITKVNEVVGLYEFSFVATQDFETVGIMLQGGGILKIAKLYKVYMAINTQQIPFSFVSAKK